MLAVADVARVHRVDADRIEQRLRQIGILRASGFTIGRVRALLLAEALVLAFAGSAIGIAGALGYGMLIVYGLRTWWIGAVGTTLLTLHVSWMSLVTGAAAGIVTAVICVALSLRAVARLTPGDFPKKTMFQRTFNNRFDGRVKIFNHPKGVVHLSQAT